MLHFASPARFACAALAALACACLGEEAGPAPDSSGRFDAAASAPDAGSLPLADASLPAAATDAQPSGADAGSPASALPCAVDAIVRSKCQSCHGAAPQGGAYMPLVSAQDFQRPAHTAPARKVHELVAERIADPQRPMPPVQAAPLNAAERAALRAWLDQAAPAGEAAACAPANPPAGDAGSDAAPAPAEDATCYQLAAHGRSGAGDTTPYTIPSGESYACFYFKAPWSAPSLSVSFRSKRDNAAALHHWFLYAMPNDVADGTVESCLPLHFEQPTMLAGWAPGGTDFVLPDDVGEENPAPGSTLMVEWHYFNNSGAPLQDRSSVEVCVVPAGERAKVASVAWLGTEDLGGLFGMPAGDNSFSGICKPGRGGMNPSEPIHVLFTTPHMHQYGRRIALSLQRADGTAQNVLDAPFSDKNQTFLVTPFEVLPTDTIKTTCSFQNTSGRNLGWGSPDGSGEMCYAFLLHYPAHSLDNGASSTLGARNVCW